MSTEARPSVPRRQERIQDPNAQQYFNTGRAIKDLLAGTHPAVVFPNFRDSLSVGDLRENYAERDHPDGKKEVVNTLRTAAAIDAATIVEKLPVVRLVPEPYTKPLYRDVPWTTDAISTPTTFRQAFAQSRRDASDALAGMIEDGSSAPVLSGVTQAISPFLSWKLWFRKDTVRRTVSGTVKDLTGTALEILPDEFKVLIDTYYGHSDHNGGDKHYPDFETFWRLVENSTGLFMRPTVRGFQYSDVYRATLTGVSNFAKRHYEVDPDYVFNPEYTEIKTKGDTWSVVVTREGLEKIEKMAVNWIPDPKHITGCPAGVRVTLDDGVHTDLIGAIINRTGAVLRATVENAPVEAA